MLTRRSIDTPAGMMHFFTLVNSAGASVTLSNAGAALLSVVVPDRDGHLDDVVLGFDNPLDYIGDGHCAGKIPGRYANRIARGRFTLDGREYTLAVNNGPNSLHGGPTGFHNRMWDVAAVGDDFVEFAYTSANGEEGFPGTLTVKARYRWTDDNALSLTMEAVTDAPTVLNLTNHAYFNLSGDGTTTIHDHVLRLYASHYLPTDDTLIPQPGAPASVVGTPMDFTAPKALGRDLDADFPALRYGKGYDNCYTIDGADGSLRLAAELHLPSNGRRMRVLTTQPAVQVYTGNWLSDTPTGKGGVHYADYAGVAIECQNYPDAPNRPDYPSARLNPGDTFHREIRFEFGVI